MDTTYRRIAYRADAIQWTGDNYADVRQFLLDNGIDDDCICADADWDEFRVFQFYAWNDDQEVDPGRWIVIDTDSRIPEDNRVGQIWTDDEFRCDFEPAS